MQGWEVWRSALGHLRDVWYTILLDAQPQGTFPHPPPEPTLSMRSETKAFFTLRLSTSRPKSASSLLRTDFKVKLLGEQGRSTGSNVQARLTWLRAAGALRNTIKNQNLLQIIDDVLSTGVEGFCNGSVCHLSSWLKTRAEEAATFFILLTRAIARNAI